MNAKYVTQLKVRTPAHIDPYLRRKKVSLRDPRTDWPTSLTRSPARTASSLGERDFGALNQPKKG